VEKLHLYTEQKTRMSAEIRRPHLIMLNWLFTFLHRLP